MEETKYSQYLSEPQIDKETVEQTRKITFVIAAEATGREHRNRFLYNWDNWSLSNFNANPIVGYQHNVYGDNMCLAPNPDDVIGKAVASIDTFKGKRALVAETIFEPAEINPTAEKVFQKVLWGSLKATSVGVNPMGKLETQYTKNEKGEVLDYQISFPGQELLEFSIVNIPADPQALKRSMKSHTLAALNFVQRSLPELSMNDLCGMRVQDILDLMEGKKVATAEQLQTVERNLVGADPNVNMYLERLSKIQNKRK
jgi:hypothetical protein